MPVGGTVSRNGYLVYDNVDGEVVFALQLSKAVIDMGLAFGDPAFEEANPGDYLIAFTDQGDDKVISHDEFLSTHELHIPEPS
jgi:hypothetical protein